MIALVRGGTTSRGSSSDGAGAAASAVAGGDGLAYGRELDAQRVGDGLDVGGELAGCLHSHILQ